MSATIEDLKQQVAVLQRLLDARAPQISTQYACRAVSCKKTFGKLEDLRFRRLCSQFWLPHGISGVYSESNSRDMPCLYWVLCQKGSRIEAPTCLGQAIVHKDANTAAVL